MYAIILRYGWETKTIHIIFSYLFTSQTNVMKCEKTLAHCSSRLQMIFIGVSLQLLMIYKENLIRWSCLLIICLYTKQVSCTTKSWSVFLLLLFWYFMNHLLEWLGMNCLASSRTQPIISSIRKLFPFFQTKEFQWWTFKICKMKSLKVLTTRIVWRPKFKNFLRFFKKVTW